MNAPSPRRLPSNRDPVALGVTAAIFRAALVRLDQQQEASELKAAS